MRLCLNAAWLGISPFEGVYDTVVDTHASSGHYDQGDLSLAIII